MTAKRQTIGLVGSVFVSACCLGGGPILAASAAALGFSAFHSVLNIYVLGPLMTISVLWIVWNLRIQGRVVVGAARRYTPFWIGLVGGSAAWMGVVLPHVIHGTRHAGTVLIILGMIAMLAASFSSLQDQRQRLRRS